MMYKTTTLWLGKLGLGTALFCQCFGAAAQENKPLPQVLAAAAMHQRPGVAGTAKAAKEQVKSLKGKVTDTKGEPLAGVAVNVKGTTIGTVTDVDGNFVLNLPSERATLVISYMGFSSQEVTLDANQNTLNISMQEDVSALQEVVVVGYGTQKKVNLTGAVAAVTFDEKLTSRAISNVSTALNGLLPGLAVNQSSGMAGNNSSALMIRGLGTVNGGVGPLVVVDGMPDVDINRLNMNDIESVSVLKDATAASVYGSRAANGVLLITTKSGAGKKPTITFSANMAAQNPTNAIDFMADYPRSLLIHHNAESMRAAYLNSTYRYGTIEQWMALGMIDPIKYPNTDWFDITMRNALQQNYNLSANGGNEVSNFFISAGILDERGLQVGNDYTRYNARINYEYKIRKNINVGARLNGDWSDYAFAYDQGFTGNGGYDLRFAVAGVTPFDPATGYYGGKMALNEEVAVFNPLAIYRNQISTRNQKQFNGIFHLEWEPIKGLKGRVDYSLNYGDRFDVSAANPTQAYNFQTQQFEGRWFVPQNAGISNATVNSYKTMATARINYNKTIAQNHEIGALVVYSEEFWNSRNLSGSRLGRLHPTLTEINAALPDGQTTSGSSTKEGLRSYIGRLNYTAFNKYLVELNARYDGSSRFYQGHQWGLFPSASVGWRFTEEGFLSKLKDWGISSGKFRASYGGLGNNQIVGLFEQREVLTPYNYILGGSAYSGFTNNRMINREFSWEKTNIFNVGLDLVLMKNRLSAEFDYYDRVTPNMAGNFDMSIHLTGMYNAPRQNIGKMRNRGVEANLTWNESTTGGFQYRINLNASYNKNRLEKWAQMLSRGSTFIDMPYHFLYSYEDIGIAQTWQDVYNATPQGISPGDLILKDLNGDGRVDENDRKAYPETQMDRPHTNFALNSSFAYKGFDLNLQLQGAAGRKDFWISQYNELTIERRYAASWDHWNNPWSVENRDGIWPRLNGGANNRNSTTFWLDNLNYLRVRNVQLGYNLPKNLLKKINVNNFRVFVSGENLYTFTSYRGVDPESTASMNDIYPLLKSFSLGLNVNL